ncbi:ABC transporter permease [Sulfuricurvum sp.]|uniref:ABC transporter permease n=1 Tax=Sulfuricurvum sp. TaxID=2025608 RepID=UPI002632ED2A|nr:ABC transporter permease [Sulfuricurvum sp.]MDD2267201.1 ABC transporter permease [Sulfuricurvum sp.]MDD2782786.1 ABC transporter permease [Sulfuricurvum sp.]
MPLFSIAALVAVILFSFIGPYLYSVDPLFLDSHAILVSPCMSNWFGTDRLGRDLLARLMEGGQISLIIGFMSAFISTMIGLLYGISAALLRGGFDKVFIIIVDLFLTFPTLFLLLTLVSYVNASVWVLIFIISVTGWMGTARLIRSESFAIASKPFIRILHIGHVHPLKIMLKYYAPLLAPIVLVSFTFGVGGAILAESGLSFLGLGIVAPQMSWGSILSGGKEVIDIAWWVSFFPGLMIFIVTFALMNISNALQARMNQKEIR